MPEGVSRFESAFILRFPFCVIWEYLYSLFLARFGIFDNGVTMRHT